MKCVFIATVDPNPLVNGQGIKALQAAGIHTEYGLCEAQAIKINRGFFSRIKRQRPWVRVKSAISIDGHIASENGKGEQISNEQSRRDVQFWRAQSHAPMTGAGTVLADNPQLNLRLSAAQLGIDNTPRQPLRFVLDSELRTSPNSNIYNNGRTFLATCSNDKRTIKTYEAIGVEVLRLEPQNGRVPLLELLQLLASDYEINEIQVEAGPTLCGALIEQGLCDEVLLYVVFH